MQKSFLSLIIIIFCFFGTNELAQGKEIYVNNNTGNDVSSKENVSRSIDSLFLTNPELEAVLHSITQAIESHNWDDFIKHCDKENYNFQRSIGIEKKQYVYEILQLMIEINDDYLTEIDSILSKILMVELITYKFDDASEDRFITIKGVVILDDGKVLDLEFDMCVKERKALITGPVG